MPSSPNTDARPLALTQGDPSGIGCELALKAWLARTPTRRPFFLLGDPDHVARTAKSLYLPVPIKTASPSQAGPLFAEALPVVPLRHRVKGMPGNPLVEDAPATIEAISTAVALVREGEAAALVTNPIAKDGLQRAGFSHPGHTEFLAELATRHWGGAHQPVMMLWSPALAVVPVTVHVALAAAPTLLSEHLIVTTGQIVARELRHRFGIERPRLALCGLNPHAGEHGRMGREEIAIISPAIAALKALDIAASGPFPADSLFHEAARQNYDAALAMYHDQALIPIKTIAFDRAVNVTLGLPFVRTSPDHGTAFDIAGRGIANPASLIAALELASRLADT
jgi:4-hydroxythreonine-4-phosphate dehydrogenase